MRSPLSSFECVLAAALFLGAACTGGDGGDPDGTPTPTPTVTATPAGDAVLFARILAGEISAAEGVAQIAASGGWPMQTAAGYVFVRLQDGNGPYELAGDHDGWQGAPMALQSGLWWIEAAVPSPIGSKYKFVDGSAQYAADAWSRRYGYDGFGEYSLVSPGASGGHLERFFGMTDGTVDPRTVRVWVPAGSATHHLYVHDGQNLFDPGAPYGGWHLQDVLGPGTLAIGIDNTPARMSDYTHVPDDIGGGPIGGDGDAYADFVENTLRPFVEARFGTPSRRATMGSSLGGLIAFHIAHRHAGRYDFAASLSGTMGWGSIGAANQTMIARYIGAGHGTTMLFLDSGGDAGSGCVDGDGDGTEDDAPDASDNYCENKQLEQVLLGVGYVSGTDLIHWWEPGATHDEAAWAARVFRPVQAFEAL